MSRTARRIVMGHPVLNANVRHAALALADSDQLTHFFTGLDTTPWPSRLPAALATEVGRRTLPRKVHTRTSSRPVPELARIAASRVPRGVNPFDFHLGFLSAQRRFEAIDKRLARAVRSSQVLGVYAYEDGAADSFEVARDLGKSRLYDLPIGYWRAGRRIFAEEAERRPGWADTLAGLRDPQWKLDRKDREVELASTILVASSYTARTLSEFPGDHAEVRVIPYGTPELGAPRAVDASSPVRVIYVGSVGQRKGIADLLDALDMVDCPTDVTVIGRPVGNSPERDRRMRGRRWIQSAPHATVLEEIAAHDVLVLPSLFEGFGLVLTEALSQGTPIIATDHTAAPDLLAGIDNAGWVVPIRDPAAIATAITRLTDPVFREHSREQALLAASRRNWDTYRRSVANAVSAQVSSM